MKRTSFVKKRIKQGVVSGTHTSLHNGLLLTSTGVPTFDDVLGGGLPVGSVLMVEEDIHRRFSTILTKYYLAEGCMCQHGLFLVSGNQNPNAILSSLPKPIATAGAKIESSKSEDMKIAFMYKNIPQHTTALSDVSKFGHYYDISSTMDTMLLEKCDTKILDLNEVPRGNCKNFFKYTLHKLQDYIDAHPQYKPPVNMTAETSVNVLRLVLSNFASPLWRDNEEKNMQEIARFLHGLRALARQSMLVTMITVPTHLFTPSQVAVFRQFVDCSVQLKAFIGEKNPAFKQYHGMFDIHKLPCVNSLTSFVPESFDLAFELRRTKFVIECFHLPPDFSDTVSRQGMDEANNAKNSTACGGTTLSKKLDF